MTGRSDAMEWTEDREKYFLEMLVERVGRDLNGSPVFKGNDWIEMDEQIFLKFALRYGPYKLKGKYHRLRSVHTKFGELINNSGVTWDALSGKVSASDTVWDDFCKRDKIFKTFKKNGCKLYPLLTSLFGSSTTPDNSHNASNSSPQTLEEHRLGIEGAESGSKKRKSHDDAEGLFGIIEKDKYETFMDVWTQSIIAKKERDLAKAKKYKTKTNEVTNPMKEEFSIVDCMAVLEATPGVSKTSYNKTLSYFLDANWRQIFLLMSKDRRKGWLDSLEN